jgi:hypothetical protein
MTQELPQPLALSPKHNPAHSLPYILNPIPCNSDTHPFQAAEPEAFQRSSDKADILINVDLVTQKENLPVNSKGFLAEQLPYPILSLGDSYMEKRSRQREEGADDPDKLEVANSKKRMFSFESRQQTELNSQPRKAVKTSNLQSATFRPRQGESKSAIWEHCQNEKFLRGQIEADPHSAHAFDEKIHRLDKDAYIFNSKNVRHIKYAKKIVMKYPYSVQNFKTHVSQCRGPPKSAKLLGAGMQLIHTYLTPEGASPAINTKRKSCPGLTDKEYPDIAAYLTRTGAHGGGAPSVTVIADELYKKKLPKTEQGP